MHLPPLSAQIKAETVRMRHFERLCGGAATAQRISRSKAKAKIREANLILLAA